jgi:hypothetical protein
MLEKHLALDISTLNHQPIPYTHIKPNTTRDLSLENACLHRRPDGLFSCHLIDLELARLVVDDGAVGATALAAASAGQRSHGGGKPG